MKFGKNINSLFLVMKMSRTGDINLASEIDCIDSGCTFRCNLDCVYDRFIKEMKEEDHHLPLKINNNIQDESILKHQLSCDSFSELELKLDEALNKHNSKNKVDFFNNSNSKYSLTQNFINKHSS